MVFNQIKPNLNYFYCGYSLNDFVSYLIGMSQVPCASTYGVNRKEKMHMPKINIYRNVRRYLYHEIYRQVYDTVFSNDNY